MHHPSAQRLHPGQYRREILHGKVGQREGVSRTASSQLGGKALPAHLQRQVRKLLSVGGSSSMACRWGLSWMKRPSATGLSYAESVQ